MLSHSKSRLRTYVIRALCTGLFLLPVVYLLFSILIICFVNSHDYAFLLGWYSRRWPQAFDADSIASVCFTPVWYRFLVGHALGGEFLLVSLLVLYGCCCRPVWRFCRGLLSVSKRGVELMWHTYQRCSSREKMVLALLFAVILFYRCYFFAVFPLHTDELCSYLFFSRPGPLIAATSYPIPNNHVFFNLVCSFISGIPFIPPKFVMRLPSVTGDLLLLYGVFCLFSRWKGFWRGIAVVIGVAFCYFTSYYAVQGRGYQWQELCALISLVSGWECVVGTGRRDRRGWPLFLVSSVCGFYINPIFLYHFLAMLLFLGYLLALKKDVRGLFFLARSVAIMALLVAIFYLPLILASSWGAFAESGYVTAKVSLREVFAHYSSFTYLLKEGTYYGRAGMYFFLVCIFASMLLYRYKKIAGQFYFYGLVYFLCVVLSLAVLILCTRMYPPDRGLCYWILGINIVFVNIVYDLILKFASRSAYWLITGFLAIKVAGSLRGLYWERFSVSERKEVVAYYKIRKDLAALKGLGTVSWQITNSDDFYPMYLKAYLLEQDDQGKVVFDRTVGRAQVVFLPDAYRPAFDLRGYVLWGGSRVTAIGETPPLKTLSIYVAKDSGR